MGEGLSIKNIRKTVLIALILSSCAFAPMAIAAKSETETQNKPEVNAVEKSSKKDTEKSLKTTPIKSFFARFSRKKNETKPVETQNEQPAVQKAGIVYNMDDCVKIALKHSPEVKNKEQTYKAQKSEVGVAKSEYFPTFTAGTGYTYRYNKYSGDMSYSTNLNNYGIDAGLSALIWDFGKTGAKINMAKYNRDAAFYELDFAKLDCIFNTKVAYTTVLATRAATDVLAQNVMINKLNVERTKAMYEVGMKSKIDVVNAESKYTEAQVSLLDAQNSYQRALINLNAAMHMRNQPVYSILPTDTFRLNKEYSIKNEINVAYDSKNYSKEEYKASIKDGSIYTATIEKRSVADSYVLNPFPLTMQEVIDISLKNRTDLKATKLLQKAAEESLKAVKRSYYPAINASGNYQYNKQQDINSNSVGFYAGLDLPQVNAMAIKNLIDKGKANLEIAKNNVDIKETHIYFDVQEFYVDMKQIEEKIPFMKKQVQYAMENFELADGRYSVGMGNYLELQEALTDYKNAQLDFVKTVFSYNTARFELERAMNITQNY